MQYQEFLDRVQQRLGAEEVGVAELATSATLATLGERIPGGEAENLAAQLPEELKARLLGDGLREKAEGFSLEEFYRRVTEREGLSVEESTEHARAVMRVLSEAATGGKLKDLQRHQLPAEFGPLLGTGYHYGEFIVRVQERAGLDTAEAADAATRATLATLGECISLGEAEDLSAQLPEELREEMTERSPSVAEDFSLEEFCRRVGERSGTSAGGARDRARAVMKVLEESVSRGELKNVRAQLPDEFGLLFD